MLTKEKKVVVVLSTIAVGFLLYFGELSRGVYLYLVIIPFYILTIVYISRKSISKEKIGLAISNCLEETDFNVIDKVEQLRVYFTDTADVISYLSTVDSRILAYVFDKNNSELTNSDFLKGAVNCLSIFKGYRGYCYFSIDIHLLSMSERITTLLSTLYMVSKQIDTGCNTIYITSKQIGDKITIDVSSQSKNNEFVDPFYDKLMSIFSENDSKLIHKTV